MGLPANLNEPHDFNRELPRLDVAGRAELPADQPTATALCPLFDLVWHAVGMERSFNYNAAGERVGQ